MDYSNFNADWVKSFKSEKAFLSVCKNNPHWFEGDEKREDKLKEVYAICTDSTSSPKDEHINIV